MPVKKKSAGKENKEQITAANLLSGSKSRPVPRKLLLSPIRDSSTNSSFSSPPSSPEFNSPKRPSKRSQSGKYSLLISPPKVSSKQVINDEAVIPVIDTSRGGLSGETCNSQSQMHSFVGAMPPLILPRVLNTSAVDKQKKITKLEKKVQNLKQDKAYVQTELAEIQTEKAEWDAQMQQLKIQNFDLAAQHQSDTSDFKQRLASAAEEKQQLLDNIANLHQQLESQKKDHEENAKILRETYEQKIEQISIKNEALRSGNDRQKANVSELRVRYFFSLALALKLEQQMLGNQCNLNLDQLFQDILSEGVREEDWASWVSLQIRKNTKIPSQKTTPRRRHRRKVPRAGHGRTPPRTSSSSTSRRSRGKRRTYTQI
eukprot:TRINITY_DN14092_c0_g1_i1.p1 TRINITY_DN14092_c0_g1~~TRINITY_DN14092_c0_g1_i1.p1  ORF type:complete len:373 (-),score=87.13 TRINITY_DN14092_c0_g1_i1:38-1156(-)